MRDGGIVPLMPAMLHVPASGEKVDLELRHFGEADGAFDLYDDDGETYNYEQGEFNWSRLNVARDANGNLQGTIVSDDTPSFSYDRMTWKFMTEES